MNVKISVIIIVIAFLQGIALLRAQPVVVSLELKTVHYLPDGACNNDRLFGWGRNDDPTIETAAQVFFPFTVVRSTKVSQNKYSDYECDNGPHPALIPLSIQEHFTDDNFKVKIEITRGRERDDGDNDDHVCLDGTNESILEFTKDDYTECDEHEIEISRYCSGATYYATYTFSWQYTSTDPGEIDAPVRHVANRQDLALLVSDTTTNLSTPSPSATFSWQYLDNFQWVDINVFARNLKAYDYILQNTSAIGNFAFRRLAIVPNANCSSSQEIVPSNFVIIRVSDTCYTQEYRELFDDGTISMAQESTSDPFVPWTIVNDTFGTSNKYIEIGYAPLPTNPVESYLEFTVDVPDTFYYLDYVMQYELGESLINPPQSPSFVKLYINGVQRQSYPLAAILYKTGLEDEVWHDISIPLSVGSNYIRWEYTKGTSNTAHDVDFYRMDDVEILKKHPDYRALTDLYFRTNGGFDWIDKDGWKDRVSNLNCDVCSWYGVTCDPITGRVIKLDLSNNGLNGKLPGSIQELVYLQELNLSNNPNLDGALPEELFELDSLEILDLSHCSISGSISASIVGLQNLVKLDLSDNEMSSTIPGEVGLLDLLDTLDLSYNNFDGSIPAGLVQLKEVEIIHFQGNQISGEIPDTFFHLSNLHELRLDSNNLSGRLTPDFGLWYNEQLRILNLSKNSFRGCYPSNLLQYCQIDQFDISGNPQLPNQGDLDSLCNDNLSLCCELSLIKDELPIASGIYRAVDSIKVTGTIMPNAQIEMSAGLSIALDYPYTDQMSSTISYSIEACEGYWPYDDALITPSDNAPGSGFGNAIEMSGDWLVVGASNVDQVYLYHLDSSGWTEKQILDGDPGSRFGNDVYINGDHLIISAYHHTGGSVINPISRSGMAKAYKLINGVWTFNGNIFPETEVPNLRFGRSVVIRDNIAVVSDYNNTISSYKVDQFSNWNFLSSLSRPGSFGFEMEYRGSTLFVGSPDATVNGNTNQGILHQLTSSSTIEIAAPDGKPNDRFSADFDIQSNKILVSVPGYDGANANNIGKAYVLDGGDITMYLPSDTTQANLQFGKSGVLMSEGIIVDNGSNSNSYRENNLVRHYFPETGVKACNGNWVAIRDTDNERVVIYRLN